MNSSADALIAAWPRTIASERSERCVLDGRYCQVGRIRAGFTAETCTVT